MRDIFAIVVMIAIIIVLIFLAVFASFGLTKMGIPMGP